MRATHQSRGLGGVYERRVLPRGTARPGGYGLRGGRLRRQEEQAPRKEPCRPPYDMSHSLQSRYFDRTSYEFLRECKALIRKNTPQVFCFVVSAFRFRRFRLLCPVAPCRFCPSGLFPRLLRYPCPRRCRVSGNAARRHPQPAFCPRGRHHADSGSAAAGIGALPIGRFVPDCGLHRGKSGRKIAKSGRISYTCTCKSREGGLPA